MVIQPIALVCYSLERGTGMMTMLVGLPRPNVIALTGTPLYDWVLATTLIPWWKLLMTSRTRLLMRIFLNALLACPYLGTSTSSGLVLPAMVLGSVLSKSPVCPPVPSSKVEASVGTEKEMEASASIDKKMKALTKPVKETEVPVELGISGVGEIQADPEVVETGGVEATGTGSVNLEA
ncbi:hypothetical protein QYF36_002236 [Acer negundo]|nr:hypothetical protein QYF36_002236 [Acer negundo]